MPQRAAQELQRRHAGAQGVTLGVSFRRFPWEKSMGKPWENGKIHGKTMGKWENPWENGKNLGNRGE